jgi:small-conductance mechanosensitive channel
LRDTLRSYEQKRTGEAVSDVASAVTPHERREAEAYALKQGARLGNVLAEIARKDERAGSLLSGEKTSKDFWRLQGRGILSFLNANPKIKGLLKFGGYAVAGFGALTSIGAILVGALSVATLVGAGIVYAGVFKQVFSGGWKKPPGGSGGGGGGGGH